jgi:hypothetical protein
VFTAKEMPVVGEQAISHDLGGVINNGIINVRIFLMLSPQVKNSPELRYNKVRFRGIRQL